MSTDLTRTSDKARQAPLQGGVLPGLVLLFSGHEPLHGILPVTAQGVELGRGGTPGFRLDDACLSRRHARFARAQGGLLVTDLGSRNGTRLQGAAVSGEVEAPWGSVVRVGDTLLLVTADLRPHREQRVEAAAARVVGPVLQGAWSAIERIARSGEVLHIRGESGAGKELAARVFHAAGPQPKGPFVAVNCSTIPEGLAERLLFGARKGAFSGAHADALGYLEAAHGGTLFLDEVGDLEQSVQAKLLRVVESRELFPLGATKPVKVDVRIVSATHKSLRELVADKRFREDLYFRIGRPQVDLPPLRARLEELPWHADLAVRGIDERLHLHAALVEELLLRPWPGNVRELVAELREAARAALAEDPACREVALAHLPATAGLPLAAASAAPEPQPAPAVKPASARLPDDPALILATLKASGGQVATAARKLGVHRTQLRRWLEKHCHDAKSVPPGGPEGGPEGGAEPADSEGEA